MKFKIGDKVRVRKDLKVGNEFDIYVTDEMVEYAGKIVTISNCWKDLSRKDRYEIKENAFYAWSNDMFEGLTIKPTKEELLKMPFGTKIITDKEMYNEFILCEEGFFNNCNGNIDMNDEDITDDLEITDSDCGTKIVEIQEPTYTIIWRKDTEVRKMTLSEVCEKLGYDVEIIKEEE